MHRYDPRWLLVFLANLLLWWLVGLANDYLSRFSLHLYVGGLFIVYASLQLDRKHGLIAIALTGLLFDAAEPVPFGTSLFLFGLIHAALLYGRRQFPREGAVFGIVVAQLANLFLFIALTFLLVGANPNPAGAWLRLFVDLLASQLAILLVAPWFLALQERTMQMMRVHPETGRRVVA